MAFFIHTSCGDEKWDSSSGLENLLDILKQSFCESWNSWRTVVLIVSVHGPNDLVWDVNWPWNKEMVSSWCIEIVHLLLLQISTTSFEFSHRESPKKIHGKSALTTF